MSFLGNENNTFFKIDLFFNKFIKNRSEKNYKTLIKLLDQKKNDIRKLKNKENYKKKIKKIFSEINHYKKSQKYKIQKNRYYIQKPSKNEETENLITNSSKNNSDEILERIFLISNSTLQNANNVAEILQKDTEILKRCNLKTKNTKGFLKQSEFLLYSIDKAQKIDKFYLYCVIFFLIVADFGIFYMKVFR